MSGHSHAKTVKRQKDATNQKRGRVFSKIAREIAIVAKEGGSNLEFNAKLRMVIEKAKSVNMPADNIERAIKRGTGETKEEQLEYILVDAYGPGDIALIIEGITDNKRRALSEIKQIVNQNGGKLVSEGAVRWLFEKKGSVIFSLNEQDESLKNKETLELITIEAGAEDIIWQNEFLNIYTKPEDLEKVKKNLEEKGIKIESSSLDWVAKEKIEASENNQKAYQRLFEALDENDAVQKTYSNLKI